MKRMLRKGHEPFAVQYKGGNFTNNLTAADVALEVEPGLHKLHIGLAHNLSARTAYVREDAVELLDHVRASTLDTIQISDALVISGFDRAIDNVDVPVFKVILDFGVNEGRWISEVGPKRSEHDLWLRLAGETLRL